LDYNPELKKVKEFKKTYHLLKKDKAKDVQKILDKITMPQEIKMRRTLFSGVKQLFKSLESLTLDVPL